MHYGELENRELAGKTGQAYCFYCTRVTLISMEEDTSLVWRKTLYLDRLNSNDLPRHFISMEEPKSYNNR